MSVIHFIRSRTHLPEKGIQNTIELLNEDCTIPFISRYRKERTGNLDEVQIAEIVKYKSQFEELEKRKLSILKTLEEQDVLTDELQQKIIATTNLTALKIFIYPIRRNVRIKLKRLVKTD